MIIRTYERQDEWLQDRKGKITGSTLGGIVTKRGTGRKIGFYSLVAERLGVVDDGYESWSPMERGSAMESEALSAFSGETGIALNTDLVMWSLDKNPSISISPDGFTEDLRVAVECKSRSCARHIEALVTQTIPSEYEFQVIQYFIVNDLLEKLYFVFYDPRVVARPYFHIEVNREDIKEDIVQYTDYQLQTLEEVDAIVKQLEF